MAHNGAQANNCTAPEEYPARAYKTGTCTISSTSVADARQGKRLREKKPVCKHSGMVLRPAQGMTGGIRYRKAAA